jgi:hypothetical protein
MRRMQMFGRQHEKRIHIPVRNDRLCSIGQPGIAVRLAAKLFLPNRIRVCRRDNMNTVIRTVEQVQETGTERPKAKPEHPNAQFLAHQVLLLHFC